MSEDEFNNQYLNLIDKGYSMSSPEVVNLFRKRALYCSNLDRKKSEQNISTQTNRKDSCKNCKSYLSHIVIDSYKGDYFLLDNDMNVIDSIHITPYFNFFKRKHNLRKFKKQLKFDLKKYKYLCRIKKIKKNKNFIKMHKNIKFYLWLCPDADYNILELIRKNITKINPTYYNYQSACAEYLHELARFYDGNPNNLPFKIYYAENEYVSNNHKYISSAIPKSQNIIDEFIQYYKNQLTNNTNFMDEYKIKSLKPYSSKFSYVQRVSQKPIRVNER